MGSTTLQRLTELAGSPGGSVQQRLTADGRLDWWIQADVDAGSAALLVGPMPFFSEYIEVESGSVLSVDYRSDSAGLRVEIRAHDLSYLEVFAQLVDDLAIAATSQATAEEEALTLLSRLAAWSRLFEAGDHGLGLSAQKGLIGELHVLQRLVGLSDPSSALATWRGPTKGTRDFESAAGALEVKATAGAAPHKVRVTRERQVDPSTADPLFLFVVILQSAPTGDTLPEVVDETRQLFSGSLSDSSLFERLLAQVGFFEIHRPHYRQSFKIDQLLAFEINASFPRIHEADLPLGIGAVSYDLSLAACEPWLQRPEQAIREFIGAE